MTELVRRTGKIDRPLRFPGFLKGPGSVLKSIIIVLLTALTFSCRPNPAPHGLLSFSERIGVISTKGGEGCFEIQNPAIPENSQIRMVILAGPQTTGEARLGVRTPACANRGDTGDLSTYTVRFENQALVDQIPAIAIVNFAGKIEKDGDSLSVDLDGDGQQEYFRFCKSTEGMHLTVWTGKPISGKLRWHQYYYLGYDIAPDCSEAELGPAK